MISQCAVIQENAFENVASEMSAILSGPKDIKSQGTKRCYPLTKGMNLTGRKYRIRHLVKF